MRTTKVVAAALVALMFATLTISTGAQVASAQYGQDATYRIEFTNTTSGQYFTPPNWAAHQWGAHVFQRGAAPSAGVAAVAESGDVPALAAELTSRIDGAGLGVSGVLDAPAGAIGPGESRIGEFTTSESEFSLVSMIVCTNDGFGGLDSVGLPQRDGQTKRIRVRAFDAGAELNTELRADIVPAPFCGEDGGTPGDQPEIDGFGIINRHPTLRGVGDLPDSFDWRGPVMVVTVTNNG